jgi:ligand-binding SRPBCC domain-containing protein
MPKIELETEIQSTLEICFDLSRSIDLHKISTAQTNEQAVAGTTSGLIGLGETVTWEATHFSIRQRLTSKITAYNRPFHFRDEQVKGAFRSFVHDHYFELNNGVVLMKDVFDFQLPLGVLGKIFNKLILTDYMTKLLKKRNEIVKNFAETNQWKQLLTEK